MLVKGSSENPYDQHNLSDSPRDGGSRTNQRVGQVGWVLVEVLLQVAMEIRYPILHFLYSKMVLNLSVGVESRPLELAAVRKSREEEISDGDG